jgi:Nif-specific regulatory protein
MEAKTALPQSDGPERATSTASACLAAILRISQRLNSEHNLNQLLDLVAVEATRLLECERASLFLYTPDRSELVSKVALGSNQVIHVPAGAGIAGSVAQTGKPLKVDDAYGDPRFFRSIDHGSGFRTRNLLAVPLAGVDGEGGVEILGAFELLNRHAGSFTAGDVDLALALAAQAGLAIQNARLIEELRQHRTALENENRSLLREIGGHLPVRTILGASRKIGALRTMIADVADCDATVLITGESGTGKDLVARALHHGSPRSRGPFVAMNCAALPDALIESELFGVERGVATGVTERPGRFEQAQGGTLFLDEIGDLPLVAQAKILRALQERVYERLGGRKTIAADARVIAATNRNLEESIQTGAFRADLFYRLNMIRLCTPALREIPEDIPLLARYLLHEAASAFKRPEPELDESALAALLRHSWPGNVRELQNEMYRAVVCTRGGVVRAADLSPALQAESGAAPAAGPPAPEPRPGGGVPSLPEMVERLERERIREALEACGYNQVKTARRLGLSRQGLINKLKRYGLRPGAPSE